MSPLSLELQAALATLDPGARLIEILSRELEDGTGRSELTAALEALLDACPDGGREEELVTRALERLVGWCAPSLAL